MEAVLYCIHELEKAGDNMPDSKEQMTAQRAYETGMVYVEEKTKRALHLYNQILTDFQDYENRCLHDTFVKGLPEFFKWYDIRFAPQNTMVSLDYPVLKDISAYTGIDKIYEFIQCICLEQKFLKLFSVDYVKDVLAKHDRHWKESMDNICERVLADVTGHILTGKYLAERNLETEDYFYIQELAEQIGLEKLQKQTENAITAIVRSYYGNDERLLDYLSGAVRGILIRLKNAADNKAPENIL